MAFHFQTTATASQGAEANRHSAGQSEGSDNCQELWQPVLRGGTWIAELGPLGVIDALAK